MTAIVEAAPAKINLALHVRRRRSDGYHDIETLFAFLTDGDLLTVEDAEHDSFAVAGPFASSLAGEGGNLVTAARDAFPRLLRCGVAAGGDARQEAAGRVGDRRRFGRRRGDAAGACATSCVAFDDPTLIACAARLGADVPACLLGRTALGSGTGADLRPVDDVTGIPVLLVNPNVAMSTAQVFAAWDGVDRGPLETGDPLAVAVAGRNDLEAPARHFAPAIGDVLDVLAAAAGVTLARMSGSGATCFALFDDAAARSAAAAALRTADPDWWLFESALA